MTAGPVITDDMLHTVLRRRANGETVEDIQPDLLIPTGRRKGQGPSLSSIYRALAEHEKARAYPEAVETAHSATRHLAVAVREQGLHGGDDPASEDPPAHAIAIDDHRDFGDGSGTPPARTLGYHPIRSRT
ncbi:hypothetical protein ACFVW8_17510 [Streptomyces sp. NPDC058221]|uniref:hypothetical protein n=1 Tax=Streptomyces sp. NPDC058221 TaxID=3346388 RepID=UPI0036E8C195